MEQFRVSTRKTPSKNHNKNQPYIFILGLSNSYICILESADCRKRE